MALRVFSAGLTLTALLCVGGCRSRSNYCPTPCCAPQPACPTCPTPVVAATPAPCCNGAPGGIPSAHVP